MTDRFWPVLAASALFLLAVCSLSAPRESARGASGVAQIGAPAAQRATATAAPPTATPTAVPSPTPLPTPTPDPRGTILDRRPVGSSTRDQIAQANARLSPAVGAVPARYAVDRHQIRFFTTDESGATLEILAQLFVPRVDTPTAMPVYVFGAGTTGPGDQCAPSREQPARNWGEYQAHMLSYATQGYIGILPDYPGYNDEARLHHYFVAAPEARTLLDAARAVYRYFEGQPSPLTPDSAVFIGGYSQGGHATFAARDIAAQYAPELSIKGAIGYAPTTDVTAMIRENPHFAPYLLYAYADLYGPEAVDTSRLLLPRWQSTLAQDVTSKCVDAVPTYYGSNARQVYQPAFFDALYGDRLGAAFPRLKEALDRNNTGLVASRVPALILQGTADPIVTPKTQEVFIGRLCAAGGRVTYRVYPNVHHFQTRQVSYRDTLAWMASIRDGGDGGGAGAACPSP